mmetsp:Transcript_10193/g.15052  ORF Transcript_10193/g.15052 Transcript_10193/m.15052 type:complete len:357 (+) Transcript_10193:155-1225(+)
MNEASSSTTTTSTNAAGLKWSEIDKVRFFTIGTTLYSALCIALHPVTVIKTRQQVLSNPTSNAPSTNKVQHQPTISSILKQTLRSKDNNNFSKLKSLYRGLGVVLLAAVPARVLYITVLESSREGINSTVADQMLIEAYFGPEEAHAYLPLVSTLSGAAAGGFAAVSAQTIVVPMDVISQRQMIMNTESYKAHGSALQVVQNVMKKHGGIKGLYQGFGLSIMSGLPTGSVWWATYGGCQVRLSSYTALQPSPAGDHPILQYAKRGLLQLLSGISAAVVASTLTQPLDVVKTRLQVGSSSSSSSSMVVVAQELWNTSGYRGFFRGLGPRIMHMGLWGTLLSGAYEFLRHVSRIDYEF